MTHLLYSTTVVASPTPLTLLSFSTWARRGLLLVIFLFTFLTLQAQTPAWNLAIAGSPNQLGGTSLVQATALDASGNILVTGSFSGAVAFGSTTLTSQGDQDIFLAKYLPATSTWAWALRAGGSGADVGRALAVSSTGIYLTGNLTNDQANSQSVFFTSTTNSQAQSGASKTSSRDLFVAKYVDAATGPELRWVAVGGGTGDDLGYGVALNGGSVYVAGMLTNTTTNSTNALFANSGNAVGTSVQYGASTTSSSDVLVAKYTDNGTTATLGWTQVGGGKGNDAAYGLAAIGNNLYLTGVLSNSLTDTNSVRFGGSGSTAGSAPQPGTSAATSGEVLVAKYVDNGATGTLGWTQVGGGKGTDQGFAVAANGSNVYVTGVATNNRADDNAVRLGGSGSTPGTIAQTGAATTVANDLLLLKYTDRGSSADLNWSQVAGGTGNDIGFGLAVNGTAVYVTGYFVNNASNTNTVVFGGTGTTVGTASQAGAASGTASQDILVARYTDNGPSATFNWSQVGGGTGLDYGYGLVVTPTTLYVGGFVGGGVPAPSFGAATGSPLRGTTGTRAVLGQLAPATGDWQQVTATANGGTSSMSGVATDTQGNVFVTGSFTGQATFGSTVLTSTGTNDLFVAKYVPATGTWAWAVSGGGTGDDGGSGIVVSGTSVYVVGSYTGNGTGNNVQFGTATISGSGRTDLVVLKYTDAGASATLDWVTSGGGASSDSGLGIAVSGTSVYVTGNTYNNSVNANNVYFGSEPLNGVGGVSYDMVLVKYTDAGTSATYKWAVAAGGSGTDEGRAVAVSGSSVYVTGTLFNSTTDAYSVRFGGVAVPGANSNASQDVFVAKYTDAGTSGAFNWAATGGGSLTDTGNGIAVSGTGIYVTGTISTTGSNASAVQFGGTPLPDVGAGDNLFLVKYTDSGSSGTYNWAVTGGGAYMDQGQAVAVSGTSVYVSGTMYNDATNSYGVQFGSVILSGLSTTASYDAVVVRYTDAGSSATSDWALAGGGNGSDYGYGVSVTAGNVYLASGVVPTATFGRYALSGSAVTTAALAIAADGATPLPVELVAFTAQAVSSAVHLAWATASERNSAYFVIERSADGTTWQALSWLTAASYSTQPHSYSYDDVTALPNGQLYYRLRQVDLDGTQTYSPVRSVSRNTTATLALYPNPAVGVATLIGSMPAAIIQVLDPLGRQVATTVADERGTTVLTLPRGLYLVRTDGHTLRLSVQ